MTDSTEVPPGQARTSTQETLFTSPAAWGWYLLGYEHGVRDGHDRGAQWIVDDLKQAGTELADLLREAVRHREAVAYREQALGGGPL